MENTGYILTEIWKARPTWLEMNEEERTTFIEEKINPMLGEMLGKGAEIMGCATNDNTGNERIDYQFMAVWKLPNKEFSDQLEQASKNAGFLQYFEQVNFSGELAPPPMITETMIKL